MAKEQTNAKSRGNGPVSVGFLDANGKVHKRPIAGCTTCIVTEKKSGKTKNYDYSKFGDNSVWSLVGLGFGNRLVTFIRNTVKNNADANVLECADSVYDNVNSGKIFTRGEGKGGGAAGRPFDFDKWCEIMQLAGKSKGKDVNDKMLAGFVAHLKALSPKDRNKHILGLQQDPHVKIAANKVNARRAEAALKKAGGQSEYDAFAEAFH